MFFFWENEFQEGGGSNGGGMSFSNERGRRRKSLDGTTMEEEAMVLGTTCFFYQITQLKACASYVGTNFVSFLTVVGVRSHFVPFLRI